MNYIKSLKIPDEPEEALAAVMSLRKEADRLEKRAVEAAIKNGWSWSQIAQALGISKQAAHKRHAENIKHRGSQ